MKTAQIILTVIILGLIVVLIGTQPKTTSAPVTRQESLVGCYVATLAKDIYTLKIVEENGLSITGTLAYNNFEKDSSTGTLTGVYDGTMLLGDYSFSSEGMDSIAQVAFKKTPEGFVRGFGETQTIGTKEMLKDTTKLSYDNSPTFVKTTCQ